MTLGYKVLWFPPDRPVEGNTIFVKPQPRVWLAGDEVPAEVMVLAPNNYVIPANSRPYRAATNLVEMPELPKFGELVAAEKERRATEGGEAP